MEVTSPGGLFADVRIDDLMAQRRVHRSRNSRLMRVLVDLGAVQDQGEGIPRMFAELEGPFLPEPSIEAPRHSFKVVLRNTPTLSVEDRSFVSALGAEDLSDQEFRALLDSHRSGRVDNARMRQITGLDTLSASRVLGRLRDRGLLSLHSAGPASFYTLGPSLSAVETDRPRSIAADRPGLSSDRPGLDSDRPGLALPLPLQQAVDALGARPRKARLSPVIEALCAHRAMGPADLARVLGFRDPRLLVRRHLKPLVDEGRLERTHPDSLSHPKQAYRARREVDND